MTSRHGDAPVIFQGLEAGLRLFRWIVLALIGLFLLSGLRGVDAGNAGLLLRFGRITGASEADKLKPPGFVWGFPFPVDDLVQVPVKREGEVVVDEVWKPSREVATLQRIDPVAEGYLLTGDNRIVQSKLVVKYRVRDPIKFQFTLYQPDEPVGDEEPRPDRGPEALITDLALASAARSVASWDANSVLRLRRTDPDDPAAIDSLTDRIRTDIQARLDDLDCGLVVTAVEAKETLPPRHVMPSFRDVQNARIAMETSQRQAEGFVRSTLPEARAQANRMIQAAKASRDQMVAAATAEWRTFSQLHEEYTKNPQLVWQRLTLESLETLLATAGKLRFVPLSEGGTLLPVGDEQR